MMDLRRLQALLHKFPQLKVGLVGDLFLDRYLELASSPPEYSIETGLEAWQVAGVRNQPGALGTVLNNLCALGAGKLVPVTVIGDDGHGFDLMRAVSHPAVDTSRVVRDAGRLTPTYTKPLKPDGAGSWRELNRLDVRSRLPLTEPVLWAVCEQVRQAFRETDGLIVLDQITEHNQGVIHDQVRQCLKKLSEEDPGKLLFVDSRRGLGRFDFGVLKGNEAEVRAAVPGPATADQAASRLASRTHRPVFCTQGAAGILIAMPDGSLHHAPAFAVEGPIDIVGAGDSATSGAVMALLAGADEREAADLGNLVASITVQQLGTTGTATPQQILGRFRQRGGLGP